MSREQIIKELSEVKGKGFLADSIRWHPELAIPAIKDQLPDHRLKIVEIIGENLVCLIEKLEA